MPPQGGIFLADCGRSNVRTFQERKRRKAQNIADMGVHV